MSKLAQAGARSTVSPGVAAAAAPATAASSVFTRATGTPLAVRAVAISSRARPKRSARRTLPAVALADEGATADGLQAEGDDPRREAARQLPCLRIVAVEHRKIVGRLRREQARLRVPVLGKAPVAVEVVGGEIEQAGDLGPETVDPF